MKKFACHYALLRFRPFVETGEFANVGVVLMAPGARFFGYRLLTRYGRITQFFHQLDRQVYLRGRGLFKQEIDRFAADLRRLALRDGHAAPDLPLAGQLFAEFVRQREAMLQFDDQRIALADDPQTRLDTLFDHYIERDFVTKEYQERLLENMVRKLLVSVRLGAAYRPEKVGNPDFTVNFPLVRRHEGQPDRIIKPLYLAQEDTTKLLTHGGQWVDKVRRLQRRNALPNAVLFPLQAPLHETKAYQAYDEIREDLLAVGVAVVSANDESSILEFASA